MITQGLMPLVPLMERVASIASATCLASKITPKLRLLSSAHAMPVHSFPVSDRVHEAMMLSMRGCEELLPEADWLKKLARSEATGKPLRIKFGLDPTAPDLHLGHTVVFNKMRQLQGLGHVVIPLIGDFTSMIGDPSGRNSTRPALTREQIEANATTYFEQISLVLDISRAEVRYNSEWSDPLGARDRKSVV